MKMKSLQVENGKWMVMTLFDGDWGCTDGDPQYNTKKQADDAIRKMQEEDSRLRESEMMYQAGMSYACGYHD